MILTRMALRRARIPKPGWTIHVLYPLLGRICIQTPEPKSNRLVLVTFPALSLNWKESVKKLLDADLDLHQNRNNWSLSHTQPVHQITSESIHNFLRCPVHRQTNRLGWKHYLHPSSVVGVTRMALSRVHTSARLNRGIVFEELWS